MIRPEILEHFGRAAARFVADAKKGDVLTASVRFLGVPQETLDQWVTAELLTVSDSGEYVCAV